MRDDWHKSWRMSLVDDRHWQKIDIDCNRWFTDCDRWHWLAWHRMWQVIDIETDRDRWLTLAVTDDCHWLWQMIVDTDRDRGLTLWRDVTAANELGDDGVEFGELGVLVFDWRPRSLVQCDQHEAGGHAQSQQLLFLRTNTRALKMTSQRENTSEKDVTYSVKLTWDSSNVHIVVTEPLLTDCWHSALAIRNPVGVALGVYHIIRHHLYVNVSF